jgi:hypothetical protein
MLRAYVFADATREANIEMGPEKIARDAVASGAFASCTVAKLWTKLMSRAPSDAEAETLDRLAADFARDYSIRRLVGAIVASPEYVEAGLFGEEGER